MLIDPAKLDKLAEITEGYGRWSKEKGQWKRGSGNVPNTRLRRIVQAASDLSPKRLSECRVLDLGCLDGQYSVEFALHGASVVGVDVRESNLVQARDAQRALGLDRLEFIRDDVRNITAARVGTFDIVVCSGLLYHLNVPDVFQFAEELFRLTGRLAIIDTHISLAPDSREVFNDRIYHGHHYKEHRPDEDEETKTSRSLASWGNDRSFVFTRTSLANLLTHVGYSSVHDCLSPAHLNYGEPGIEHRDRCAFVAVKGEAVSIRTSPSVNDLIEDHPENHLTYPLERPSEPPGISLRRRVANKLLKVLRRK
jgi:SAM-dependent methyltransferase